MGVFVWEKKKNDHVTSLIHPPGPVRVCVRAQQDKGMAAQDRRCMFATSFLSLHKLPGSFFLVRFTLLYF